MAKLIIIVTFYTIVCQFFLSCYGANQVVLTCASSNEDSIPGPAGPPGKRGPPGVAGPPGLQGEPGANDTWKAAFIRLEAKLLNIETDLQFAKGNGIQKHHVNALTWQYAFDFCSDDNGQLCSFSEIFPYGNNTVVLAVRHFTKDTWVPIRDLYNDWVQVGDNRIGTRHSIWNPPTWGVSTVTHSFKGNFFCCMID